MNKRKVIFILVRTLLPYRGFKFISFALILSILLNFSLTSSKGVEILIKTPEVHTQSVPLTDSAIFNISSTKDFSAALETDLVESHIYNNGFVYSEEIPLSRELQEYIFTTCKEQGLSYTLVLALIWRESRFVTDIVGYNTNGTTDSGLMQINDVNRGWLKENHGITDLIDARENVRGGTALLGMFVEKHGEQYGLLAYEWGEAGMKRNKNRGITTSKLSDVLYNKQAEFEELLYT